MRFNFEMSGVIDAKNEAEADVLARRIARDAQGQWGAEGHPMPDAVLASFDVQVVVPKTVAA